MLAQQVAADYILAAAHAQLGGMPGATGCATAAQASAKQANTIYKGLRRPTGAWAAARGAHVLFFTCRVRNRTARTVIPQAARRLVAGGEGHSPFLLLGLWPHAAER